MAGQGRGERCEIDPLQPVLHWILTNPAKAGAELIDRCFRASQWSRKYGAAWIGGSTYSRSEDTLSRRGVFFCRLNPKKFWNYLGLVIDYSGIGAII